MNEFKEKLEKQRDELRKLYEGAVTAFAEEKTSERRAIMHQLRGAHSCVRQALDQIETLELVNLEREVTK